MNEKREYLRVPLDFIVQLQSGTEGLNEVNGRTRDLSLRGVCLSCEQELKVGEDCVLQLRLGEGEEAVVLEIEAAVVRTRDGLAALEFNGIRGVETLDHLRRLIMYNADDAGKVEEEIRMRRGIERIPRLPRDTD